MKTVAIGGGPAPMRAALRTHLVDAAISTTALFLAFEETKEGRLIAPVSSYRGQCRLGRALRLERADRQQSRRDPRLPRRLDRDRRLYAGAQGRDGEDRERASTISAKT